MINTRILYNMYGEVINLKINNLLEENISYHTIHMNLMNRIEFFKPYIDYCCNYTVEEILNFTRINQFYKVLFKTNKIFINNYTYTRKALELYITKYIGINKIIINNERKIDKLKKQLISYKQYYFIIRRFNTMIADAIIEEGYIFNPGHAFGSIYIEKMFNTKERINISASMIAKRELESKGLIPYCKADEDRHKELGKTYNGQKYFVYYPKEDYMIKWVRGSNLRQFFPFLTQFKYKAARSYPSNSSITSRMREFIKVTSANKLDLLFNRTYQYEGSEVS